MPYRIELEDAARHEIEQLPGYVRQQVRRKTQDLANNPRPPASKELREMPNRYRLRLLKWRIIYDVVEDDLLVNVITVRLKEGPETYENLDIGTKNRNAIELEILAKEKAQTGLERDLAEVAGLNVPKSDAGNVGLNKCGRGCTSSSRKAMLR